MPPNLKNTCGHINWAHNHPSRSCRWRIRSQCNLGWHKFQPRLHLLWSNGQGVPDGGLVLRTSNWAIFPSSNSDWRSHLLVELRGHPSKLLQALVGHGRGAGGLGSKRIRAWEGQIEDSLEAGQIHNGLVRSGRRKRGRLELLFWAFLG